MKILQLIPTYKPAYVYGGPIFSVSSLCEQLAAAGHSVRMLTTTANGPQELPVTTGRVCMVDGVEVLYFKRYTGDHTHLSPGLVRALWHQCRQFDAVHIHSWWNIPVMMSVLVCWLRGVRPVLSPRGMLSDFTFGEGHSLPKRIIHKTIGAFLLRKTRLHLTSEAEKAEAEKMGVGTGVVLPNIIEQAAQPGPPLPRNHPPVLLFLSRIHPKKNLESLLEALAGIGHDFQLIIAGSGEEEYLHQLRQRTEALRLHDRVRWIGPVAGEEKFRCYGEADLFVLPSLNENFANVVVEALSAGTPVLVSRGTGLAAYVEQRQLGWVCDSTPPSIAEALKDFFENPDKSIAFGKEARATVQRDFAPKRIVKDYLRLYQGHDL